jgi:type VI secretion system protein VasG
VTLGFSDDEGITLRFIDSQEAMPSVAKEA